MKKRAVVWLLTAMMIAAMPGAAWSAAPEKTEAAAAAEETPAEGETGADDAASAEGTGAGAADSDGSSSQEEPAQDESIPQDNIVTTNHTACIQGKDLSYTAQAGTMVLETGGSNCEIFFTAYTLDGVEDPADRPLLFAFNGGPGSCSMYLHVGCFGPRRVDVDEKGYPKSMPVQMTDNENSLLDLTDIVIIDAVGTGYSRSLEESDDPFIGYDNDVRTMGDFIRQYISRNSRWGSRKYVAGESYGTTRAIGICEYLFNAYSINLNGVMLISSINDCAAVVFEEGNDLPYATFIPTYAADAWYQGVVSPEYQEMKLEDYLDEVRAFVRDEYVPALFQGTRSTEEETDALAEKYAAYTGLKKEYVLGQNLRVELDDFLTELLRDRRLMVGRIDGRITGPAAGGSIDNGENDPSSTAFDLSFGNVINAYTSGELGFETDRPYIPAEGDINNSWTFPIDSWGGYLSQEQTIRECISKNPFLKVWVLCGYYDAATPFFAAEYTFSHLFLNDELRDNLSFTYYQCGHMIYMEKESFDQFRKDAEAWLE